MTEVRFSLAKHRLEKTFKFKLLQPAYRPYLALALVCFFWGTTFLSSRIGVRYMHGIAFSAIRQSLAGILMLVIGRYRGEVMLTGKALIAPVLVGIFILCGGNAISSWAMSYITSGLGCLIATCTPILIIVLGAMTGEKMGLTQRVFWGLFWGLMGVLLICIGYWADLFKAEFRWGLLLMFLSCLSVALGTLILMRNNRPNSSNFISLGIQMLAAGMLSGIITFAAGLTEIRTPLDTTFVASVAYLIVFGSLVGYTAYIYAMRKLPPAQVQIYAYVNPVVAVLVGYLILSEPLSWYILLGCATTLFGVYLVNSGAPLKRRKADS